MAEFWVPSADEFQSWDPSYRPVAVVRIRCTHGHDVAEWWLTGSGADHPWNGVVPRGERGPIHQESVGGFVGIGETAESAEWVRWPVNPQRPDDSYFRFWIRCLRPTCNYQLRLDDRSAKPESVDR